MKLSRQVMFQSKKNHQLFIIRIYCLFVTNRQIKTPLQSNYDQKIIFGNQILSSTKRKLIIFIIFISILLILLFISFYRDLSVNKPNSLQHIDIFNARGRLILIPCEHPQKPNREVPLKELRNDQRREAAWRDVQIIVSKNADKRHLNQIDKIIIFFKDKYLKSFDLNRKIAGLQVMPYLVNGLKNCPEGIARFAQPIVVNILDSLNDGQHKIRMTALKTLYYIAKTLDDKIIGMFNIIFEKLIGKINDLDEIVRNAANFFDKSLQTILTSALNSPQGRQQFDLEGFMNIVKAKLKYKNPGVRQFLIKWIVSLNEIMSIDLLIYLPDLLQDLLFMLGDKEKGLRTSAQECLSNFERDMVQKFEEGKLQNYLNEDIINKIVSILVSMTKGKYQSLTILSALGWLKTLFSFFRSQVESKIKGKLLFKKIILERFDEILESILLLMSHEQQQVRKASISANDLLMQNITLIHRQLKVNFNKVMPLLKQMLAQKKSSSTSQSALKWMKFLLQNYNDKILPEIKEIIEKLVEKLCDANVKNVNSIIENTSVRQQYFELLIEKMLLLLLHRNPNDLQYRPQQILKKFSQIQEGDKFCRSICSQIVKIINDKRFTYEIVHYLSILLINEKTMMKMRRKLQDRNDPDYHQNFMVLFQAFKCNPAALVALCLLSRQYRLAYEVILSFANDFQISQKVMMGFCKLASLLQAPGFLPLRLQLLQRRQAFLLQSLSALLMILPQGKVFNMLKNRLEVAKLLNQPTQPLRPHDDQVNIEQCLIQYRQSQLTFPRS